MNSAILRALRATSWSGRLRIGMIPTVAPYLLPRIIGNLTRVHPELDIQVREALTPKLIQELDEGRLDTAILALPVSEPSLTEVALFTENFLLVRPRKDEGTPVPSREMLREMRLLLLEEGHCFRDQALSFCKMHSGAARTAGCELAVHARADGERRRRRHPDPRNGGGGRDPLGIGVGRAFQEAAAFADHRHGLAQDQSAGAPAHADLRRRVPGGRQGPPAEHERIAAAQSTDLTTAGSMPTPTIRPALPHEYDEVARVWMESWVSIGLAEASNFLLANLRARVRHEIEHGWSLYVADDDGTFAAMLALHLPDKYLDQLFVAPEYQGKGLGRRLLAFTRQQLPDEIRLRCVRENEKAWRWYEREGFVFEKEEIAQATGFMMKHYRWMKQETIR